MTTKTFADTSAANMSRDSQTQSGEARQALGALSVTSGSRGRPLADLVEEFERKDPAGAARSPVARSPVSSAALRAADNIRAMRLEARMSQSELAAKLGVKPSRISELEAGAGRQGPTWDVMERVAAACGRTIAFQHDLAVFAAE